MRIGILGGSFNPPHSGHLQICDYAHEDVFLDKILLIPSGDHPFKRQISLTKVQRLEMSRLMSLERDYLEVCDYESKREGISYTADTLEALRGSGSDEFFFICGSDIIFDLTWWKNFRAVFRMTAIVCIPRASEDNSLLLAEAERLNRDFNARIIILENRCPTDISSSMIREDTEAHREFLSSRVYEYIAENGLYDGEGDAD